MPHQGPQLVLLLAAALAYTLGGVCMKHSAGLTRLLPSLAIAVLFLGGAACQALAMRRAEMSVAYIYVLGLESILAFVFGVVFFLETITAPRLAAVAFITLGIVLLHR